jgi:hypothetical protein
MILGEDVILQIYKGGEWLAYYCATDVSIAFDIETVQVRAPGDGRWRKYRAKTVGYNVSLSGLVAIDGTVPTAFDMWQSLTTGGEIPFRMTFKENESGLTQLFEGVMLTQRGTIGGASTGHAAGDFEFIGIGEAVLKTQANACTASIGTLDVQKITVEGGPGQISVNLQNVQGAIRIELYIDGNPFDTVFDPPTNSVRQFNYDTPGNHIMEARPMCDNGDFGTFITDAFTI